MGRQMVTLRLAILVLATAMGGVDAQSCDSNPCQNGGTCTESSNGKSYTCECSKCWKGQNCDKTVCTRGTCKTATKQSETGGEPGYTCCDVHSCEHGACKPTTGECDCPNGNGYKGDRCDQIVECPSGPPVLHATACGTGKVNNTCSVTCAYGYKDGDAQAPPKSKKTYTCEDQNKKGVWSPSDGDLKCQPVQCDQMPPDAMNRTDPDACTMATYPHSCTFSCS